MDQTPLLLMPPLMQQHRPGISGRRTQPYLRNRMIVIPHPDIFTPQKFIARQ
jgi:hypothetical protein